MGNPPITGTIKPADLRPNNVRVYEYGVRLDAESISVADAQVAKARTLYNNLVEVMRRIHAEMNAWVMAASGPEVAALHERIESLLERFMQARAANDDLDMANAASERRAAWRELAPKLAAVRRAHAKELRERFYGRIGRNSTTETYLLRSAAVEDGLGWGTANAVLDRALKAWADSMKLGQPPRFARGDEIDQDSLVLQFTTAGGVPVEKLLAGEHGDIQITCKTSAGRRSYGELRFRLGAAKAEQYATGTWQYQRDLPSGAHATFARLLRVRAADRMKWRVQIIVRLPESAAQPSAPINTLATIHVGWSADDSGRRVAAVASGADPGLARLIQLPASIEEDLLRAQEITSNRSIARDAIVPKLREIDLDALPEPIAEEVRALRMLPAQHIAARRMYRLSGMLRNNDRAIPWLDAWISADRKAWQATTGIARRARLRRREFYRLQARDLASRNSALVIEIPDLKAAAITVDEKTGERTEFAQQARFGRTVAALYEFEQEIRAACSRFNTALFDLRGEETVATCAHCGAPGVVPAQDDHRELVCPNCGARTERRAHGAARAWQISSTGIEERIVDFHLQARRDAEERAAVSATKKAKMAEGRRQAIKARLAEAEREPQVSDETA